MITIDERFSRIILDMESVCYSEGMGPNSDELLKLIFEEFPHLIKEYELTYKQLYK